MLAGIRLKVNCYFVVSTFSMQAADKICLFLNLHGIIALHHA